ncbi:MAG: BamA/TamA family outer membrane protein, partial [Gemmatimonadetes bacterium]|nr:BamA/TamA family outer membrane protein [Gemmatimonadota bacterium]NIQ60309.1 BamA/TamA family outer membrane protein [Gemmatimonadota bacterium]NIU80527.1 BamA/TamA family outer membrane protein [Gammaproteobacteria bacterium]NIX48849.1 BamA/TamA family outer membrane protein [Gemmatimonadota bacterium]NIY13302.1 BamA/TamA family outer membrane protein [Gemmatimonadota bacterium]
RRIDALSFENTAPFSADSLDALTETEETHCALVPGLLPFCLPGTKIGRKVRRLEPRTLGEDLTRLELLYRQSGYFGTRVVPEIEEEGDDGPIHIRLIVQRGDGIRLDSVVVEGTEGIADPDSLAAALPLRSGELFDLGEFVASADTVVEALRERGHAYAEVLRNFSVDTVQDRATVWLLAVPGPRVEVDTVLLEGLDVLAPADVTRQLEFETGELLRARTLQQSQRNLYDLRLVQFASVAVAPDSLQATPEDSTTASVLVSVAEGPEHVVEAGVGFGTVECGRVGASWTDRSVLGRARVLSVTGSVSRIGVGDPISGLESSVCNEGRDTAIARFLDYRLATDFTQPYFLSPRNQLTVGAYAERQSEARLFRREAWGSRLSLSHRLRFRELLTTSLEVERRRTTATAILYCFEFLQCGTSELDRFAEPVWRNALSVGWLRDRSDNPVNPTGGHVLRSSLTWSAAFLQSDYEFLRANVEGSLYRSVGDGWVLAGFLRLGSLLTRSDPGAGPDDPAYLPPEERFFVGGANSVRGYERFELGPGVWLVDRSAWGDTVAPGVEDEPPVDFFPTGGASAAVASAEARLPSPFLSDLVRLALFVDAGIVGGSTRLWEMEGDLLVTPGAGLRIQTPVGPARIDLGYNPNPLPTEALYFADPATNELSQITDAFQPPPPGFMDRLKLHIAVGQAF